MLKMVSIRSLGSINERSNHATHTDRKMKAWEEKKKDIKTAADDPKVVILSFDIERVQPSTGQLKYYVQQTQTKNIQLDSKNQETQESLQWNVA
jgi:hypothetical protein